MRFESYHFSFNAYCPFNNVDSRPFYIYDQIVEIESISNGKSMAALFLLSGFFLLPLEIETGGCTSYVGVLHRSAGYSSIFGSGLSAETGACNWKCGERTIDAAFSFAVDEGGESEEGLSDVFAAERAGLYEIDASLFAPFVDLSQINQAWKVAFVAQKKVGGVRCSFESEIVPNIADVAPRQRVRLVEDQNDSFAGFKVSCNDGSEFLLSGCVPYAKANFLVVEIDIFVAKVDGCAGLIRQAFVVDVAPEKGGFAHPAVPYKDDFVGWNTPL